MHPAHYFQHSVSEHRAYRSATPVAGRAVMHDEHSSLASRRSTAIPAPAHLLERHLPHVHLCAQRQQHRVLAVRVCAAHEMPVGDNMGAERL